MERTVLLMPWMRVDLEVRVTPEDKEEEAHLTDAEYVEGAVYDHLKGGDIHGPFTEVEIKRVREVC